jgi:CubicO group peptidase (beta-lactamase class C family)
MKKIFTKAFVILILYIIIGGSTNIVISNNITKSDFFNNIEDFDKKIEVLMKEGHFPSVVACIVKEDKILWCKAYGYADIRPLHKRETTVDTVYPIGSISKTIAAVAIMQLNESGLIGLDDNISEYLPFDLKNPNYPDINITPRMLLAHQSSIKYLGFFYSILTLFILNPLRWFEHHFKKPSSWCDYAPGEEVLYATIDINLLGYVIEYITGQSYSDYCQEHIFKPLEMYNTSFYLSDFKINELVRQYARYGRINLRVPFLLVPEIWFAGGGLRSTISDMSHFLMIHTNGGVYNGIKILSEKSIKKMHQIQYPNSIDGSFYHGLGWYLKNYSDGETYGGHDGTHFGAYAVMNMRYSDNVGVMFFYNQHPHILMILNKTPEWEDVAKKEIRKALYEKANEI